MNTKDLRCFSRVYEERSVNQAAKQLFISPQGLSKIIKALEEELGTSLFSRTRTGMTPTAAGVYLYEHAVPLLEHFDEIETTIRHLGSERFELGFSCGVLHVFPFEKLEQFREKLPGVEIHWEEAANQEILDKVCRKTMDAGFVIGPVSSQELWSQCLYAKKLDAILYKGHRFFERESISIQELEGEPLITLNETYHCYHSLLARFRDFGITPSIRVKTMDSRLIYRLCKKHLGVGVDVNIHGNEPLPEGLSRVEIRDSIPWRISLVAREERRKDPAIQTLVGLFARP